MRRIYLIISLIAFAASANAFEMMTQYNHYLTTQTADTLITTQGLDGQNTKFIVGKYQTNVFQPCGVLQFGGFIKTGNCGSYKTGSQLWTRKANLSNLNTNGIAVRVYPSTTPAATIYATPDSEYFIVGNTVSYTWQDCGVDVPSYADSVNYKLVGSCTSGLALWKRITPVQ